MNAGARAAAVLEVLGVYLGGQLVTTLLVRGLNLQIPNPLENFTVSITDTELLVRARNLFVSLLLQYAGYFVLIIPINWWHRRRGPRAYGLTRAGRSWKTLVLAGVGTVAATTLILWPVSGLLIADQVCKLGLGETVPWRQALFDMSWGRWEFWLFMAVLSFGLVAFLEELFFRGYCQRRLAEDWGDGPAIVGTSLLFVCAHSQYMKPDLYNLCLIATVLVLALGFGVIFAWSRSLVPPVIAHALINTPISPFLAVLFLIAYVSGGIIIARCGRLGLIKQVFAGATVWRCAVLGVIGAAWAIASQRIERLEYVASGMVVLAVGLEIIDRKRQRSSESCGSIPSV
jgi:membrane protease YdiL (CAAX protease family)